MKTPLCDPVLTPVQRAMPPDPGAPIGAFVGCALTGLFVGAALYWVVFDAARIDAMAVFVGLSFYAIVTVIAGIGLRRHYPHAVLGLCNMVTLLRLVMVGVLVIGWVSGIAQSWALLALAVTALALDGVDGWLARRQNLTSGFGARFDMEVDAIFALVLSLTAYSNGVVGPFVLLLGLPSYVFFIAKFAFPWLDNPLPDLFSRKVVCVAQLAVLIALQIPLDMAELLAPLTFAAAAALVWSFGRDIIWLARTHR
ncbi:MAG: CDP-alcohol phosphatidyltransferase family protein [Octadecabacter sp.]